MAVDGAIRPGFKADLMLIDLDDAAYLPFNSAARQLVYSETGRAIETVVMKDRKMLPVDEDALRDEVGELRQLRFRPTAARDSSRAKTIKHNCFGTATIVG
jgi:cytosine/adenosine deaminase-related metal-dependent hydrolase